MIEIKNLSKSYEHRLAIDRINLNMQEGSVFGLVGTNGAGKSTLLRVICGILKPDSGNVLIDGEGSFENPRAKERIFYISDDQYYPPSAKGEDMKQFYKNFYPKFDEKKFESLMGGFHLDARQKISTFSKGMKKQLSIILGLCANTPYLLCDETFDGLDPVMRQAVKSLFAQQMQDRNLTPIIASHSLRELEDICDHVGLLHRGGVLLSREIEDMKLSIHKLQVVLREGMKIDDIHGLEIVQKKTVGSVHTLVCRGDLSEIKAVIERYHPIFFEAVALSLEEVFISETEVKGYDIKSLVL